MKKLLSILSIGSVLASTAPAVTACTATATKLDLSNLSVTGIEVTKPSSGQGPHRLQINVKKAFKRVIKEILKTYKTFGFKGDALKASKFAYGDKSALTADKTWAIQIMDGNKTPMTTPSDPTTNSDIFPSSGLKGTNDKTKSTVLLKNNALEVKIVTTNKNVKDASTTAAIAHAYLSKFVYSGANINQGNDIYASGTDKPTADALAKALHVDGASQSNITFTATEQASAVVDAVKGITGTAKTAVSKTVLDALNTQLKDETKVLTNLDALSTTGEINFGSTVPTLYAVSAAKEVTVISGNTPVGASNKIYVRLDSLGLSNYIGNLNSYLYLYLGTTPSS